MDRFTINGLLLKEMLLTGATLLEQNKAAIDALNVFPVPDGDTGTNMSMTMQSAANAIKEADTSTVAEVAAKLSSGALRGARGNSGVILSQIFRGFSKALKGCETIDSEKLAAAFVAGSEAAYKAVMRPKEGTILTVIKSIAQDMRKAAIGKATVEQMLDVMMKSGEETLKKTPELLPVLKEAGVVDSGGAGLMLILRGMRMAFLGEGVDTSFEPSIQTSGSDQQSSDEGALGDDVEIPDIETIKFAYCTEFFIINLFEKPTEQEIERLRARLGKLGDSVVVAYDDDFIKVHVHTSSPGMALQLALHFGELDRVKIENMLEQNREMRKKQKAEEKELAIISVCTGDGIESIFKDLGANAIISGGQTMNPSIESIVKTVKKVNARNVFILPNNSNIILAAQQAASIIDDCNVIVIPSTTIMQGITAIMAFGIETSAEDNKKNMTDAISAVISGSVTYAVRSTSYNGMTIEQGDILAMINNKIVKTGKDVAETSEQLLREMINQQPEDTVVTVIYGEGMTEDDANALVARLEDDYPDADFIVQYGGQPLYHYYFSVE